MIIQQEKEQLKKELKQTLEILTDERQQQLSLDHLNGETNFHGVVACSPLYLFATEDIRGYSSHFNKVDSYLTVAGSGDQVMNAVLMGAKNIDVFDANPLAKRAVALKVAAAKTLDRESFLKFYDTLSRDLFEQVKTGLDEKNYAYWNGLFECKYPEDIYSRLFGYEKLQRDIILGLNPYLDIDSYHQLAGLLQDVSIHYIDADLYSLPQYIGDKKYDGMNLSNIYEYIVYNRFGDKELVDRFYHYIMNELCAHLTDDGKMMVSYLYAFNDEVKQYVELLYTLHPDRFVRCGGMTAEELAFYLQGLTTQNMGYCKLFDAFQGEKIEKVKTKHLKYGQSIDMSHDTALFLRK